MQREVATVLLNRLVDEQILEAKEHVEKEIEVTLDRMLSETKREIMDAVDRILAERIISGREVILSVLERAASETDFMAALAEDPEKALQNYGLTAEERAAIASGDIRAIEGWVGKLTPEQSKWLWARLQQERW